MPRLLFLCSRNRWRSPTAEVIFADWPGVETDSAGLSPDAEVVVSSEQIEWADKILVMEPEHRARLKRKFGKWRRGKPVVVLGIPDEFPYMDEELVRLLRAKCAPHLG
ncbi:MAG: low molecular weight protein tyrosine phosphatase family protein [Verrucomicrobiales bacterium]